MKTPARRHAVPGGTWDAVLFDLDGTLADTVELILASFRHTMRFHFGEAPPDAEWLSTIGRPLHDQFGAFAGSESELRALVETYVAYQRSVHDEMTRPYPGVRHVLDAIRRNGAPLAVVTSKRSGVAFRTLECCGIRDQFQVVVCADHVSRGKPDPEPVTLALARLGVTRPERVLFVGDSPYDMEAGREGGVRTAGALWGPFPEGVLLATEPDYLVREIQEVVALSP